MIKPSIGRIVLFFSRPPTDDGEQPLAAIVARVFSDRCVNLAIFAADGRPVPVPPTSVTLVQPGDPTPASGPYCTWMPFQVAQAKRNEW